MATHVRKTRSAAVVQLVLATDNWAKGVLYSIPGAGSCRRRARTMVHSNELRVLYLDVKHGLFMMLTSLGTYGQVLRTGISLTLRIGAEMTAARPARFIGTRHAFSEEALVLKPDTAGSTSTPSSSSSSQDPELLPHTLITPPPRGACPAMSCVFRPERTMENAQPCGETLSCSLSLSLCLSLLPPFLGGYVCRTCPQSFVTALGLRLYEAVAYFSTSLLKRANHTDIAEILHTSLLASLQGGPGSTPGGAHPDFRMWESCRTIPLVGRFSRGYSVYLVLSFRRCSIPTLITLVGSQDLTIKSRLNLEDGKLRNLVFSDGILPLRMLVFVRAHGGGKLRHIGRDRPSPVNPGVLFVWFVPITTAPAAPGHPLTQGRHLPLPFCLSPSFTHPLSWTYNHPFHPPVARPSVGHVIFNQSPIHRTDADIEKRISRSPNCHASKRTGLKPLEQGGDAVMYLSARPARQLMLFTRCPTSKALDVFCPTAIWFSDDYGPQPPPVCRPASAASEVLMCSLSKQIACVNEGIRREGGSNTISLLCATAVSFRELAGRERSGERRGKAARVSAPVTDLSHGDAPGVLTSLFPSPFPSSPLSFPRMDQSATPSTSCSVPRRSESLQAHNNNDTFEIRMLRPFCTVMSQLGDKPEKLWFNASSSDATEGGNIHWAEAIGKFSQNAWCRALDGCNITCDK
ncbi:hypothetical protein PR048_014790 [Dryococelus australis]|uniref:Uncharacterized protein n=1 Tax=Dryococelus australis TaxID=614101 RepID=A0ABQ9HFK9_9NEOP|nr:hypothetical protein PR048_014790 [Dryococelus australis]